MNNPLKKAADKNELVEKIIKAAGTHRSEGIDGCGHCHTRHVNNLTGSKAKEIISICESHLTQQLEQRVVEAIEKLADDFDANNIGKDGAYFTDCDADVAATFIDAIEAVREVFK